jgi:thiol-disulfide isomerase/thioredoxin
MNLKQFGRLALLSIVLSAGFVAPVARADDDKSAATTAAKFGVGQPAPALKVEKFIKGDPVSEFKKGHVYIVEMWATWCGPCIRMFPHLSELQEKHKDQITIIGVNVWEDRGEEYSEKILKKVTDFVNGRDTMRYTVAYDGGSKNFIKNWAEPAMVMGIPHAFVVNQDGVIAWSGHPAELDDVLPKVLDKTWDVNAAKSAYEAEMEASRKQMELQKQMQKEMEPLKEQNAKLRQLMKDGNRDEALPLLIEIGEKAPNAGMGAANEALSIMLSEKKDFTKAYEFATKLVDGPYKDNSRGLNMIAWTIVDPAANIENRNADLALRAAKRASELEGDKDPMILDTLARAHFLKGDKAKAIEIQTKALAAAPDELKGEFQKSLDEFSK